MGGLYWELFPSVRLGFAHVEGKGGGEWNETKRGGRKREEGTNEMNGYKRIGFLPLLCSLFFFSFFMIIYIFLLGLRKGNKTHTQHTITCISLPTIYNWFFFPPFVT